MAYDMFQAQSLGKTFQGRLVVRDVTLSIARGQIVGLFGPNGAGKTTTFLMMAGLLRPDQGEIWLDEHQVTQTPLYRKAALGVRYLPQESSIFRGLTVYENLWAVAELYPGTRAQRQDLCWNLLKDFGLTDWAHQPAVVLSGGQRRRLEIARALIGDPSFLLLDEPLAGIDPKAIHDVGQGMRQMADQGRGILVTDHNVKDMLPLVDHAYILVDGQVLCQGPASQVAQHPMARSLYLGESFVWPHEDSFETRVY